MEIIRLVVKDTVETRIRKLLADKHGEDTGEDGAESSGNGGEGDRLLGSIKEDKTELLLEEFDLLYGYDATKEAEEDRHQASVKSEKAAKVESVDNHEESDDEEMGYVSDECNVLEVATL